MTQQWEYKVLFDLHWSSIPNRLNEMGEHGWELVSVVFATGYQLFFKKPKEGEHVRNNNPA
jgi:hypothetical protein